MRIVSTALAATFLLAPVPAAEAAGAVRASCTQAGKSVHREDIPEGAPAERRILIAARYPDALCVFLGQSDPARAAAAASTSHGTLPPELLAAATGEGADGGLAAALMAITGGRPAPEIGSAVALDAVMAEAGVGVVDEPEAPARTLTLALAVYRGMGMAEILAHWSAASAGRATMSRMTPTVSSAGDVSVLTVEGVMDAEAGPLCEEAASAGLECLAAY